MAAPSTPTNFIVQQADGNVLCSWDISSGATSYVVQRSTDALTYATIGTPTAAEYLDATATVNTLYYYQVAATNGTASQYTVPQSTIPTLAGVDSLASIRLQAQQRADKVNSNFLSKAEWNKNINQSAAELYDLLVTLYEDYYMADPYTITTNGTGAYSLPAKFYKLLGINYAIGGNAAVSLKKFNFAERNNYAYSNVANTFNGVADIRYRIMGSKLRLTPLESTGQLLTVYYIPRLTPMLADTDTLDGVNGWTEYVIVDAAIKAMQKEESDVSVLMAEKQMLLQRIQDSAQNRDAGLPNTISRTRSRWSDSGWGE